MRIVSPGKAPPGHCFTWKSSIPWEKYLAAIHGGELVDAQGWELRVVSKSSDPPHLQGGAQSKKIPKEFLGARAVCLGVGWPRSKVTPGRCHPLLVSPPLNPLRSKPRSPPRSCPGELPDVPRDWGGHGSPQGGGSASTAGNSLGMHQRRLHPRATQIQPHGTSWFWGALVEMVWGIRAEMVLGSQAQQEAVPKTPQSHCRLCGITWDNHGIPGNGGSSIHRRRGSRTGFSSWSHGIFRVGRDPSGSSSQLLAQDIPNPVQPWERCPNAPGLLAALGPCSFPVQFPTSSGGRTFSRMG